MQDYQQRVVDEKSAVRDKFDRLETFIAGKVFSALPREDQALLQEQRGYMSVSAFYVVASNASPPELEKALHE